MISSLSYRTTLLTILTIVLFSVLPATALAGTQTFSATGADQTFTVPAGVTSIDVQMWGGGGQWHHAPTAYSVGSAPGGTGGYTSGTLRVTPGQQLLIMVGQAGHDGFGGYGGGGSINDRAYYLTFADPNVFDGPGAGGGRSAIFQNGVEMMTAGGGGGTPYRSGNPQGSAFAGDGGGLVGGFTGDTDYNGYVAPTTPPSYAATGGTQTGGGTCGGDGCVNGADPGSRGQGGNARTHSTTGAGGGGYYGGGGSGAAGNAGGGGGSGYCGGAGVSDCTTTKGQGAGPDVDGKVTISWSDAPPPPPPPPAATLSCQITFDKNPIAQGESTKINWSSAGSPTAFNVTSMGWVGASGAATVAPSRTTNYSGTVYKCPAGTSLNDDATFCVSDSPSTSGADPEKAQCATTLTVDCPTGQTWDLATSQCVAVTPICIDGYHLDTATNQCVTDTEIVIIGTPRIVGWGTTSVINWSAEGATSCTGTGFDTGGATSGSYTTDPLLQTTTFTLTCDTGTKTVTIEVPSCPAGYTGTPPVCTLASNTCPIGYEGTPPNCSVAASCPLNYTGTPPNCVPDNTICVPSNICNGNNVVNSCTGALIQSCAYSCTNGACVVPPPTVVSWTVAPLIVNQGATTNVSWEVRNVSSCTVSGTNGDSWTGLTGTKVSGPINSQTIFTLHCIALAGSNAANVTRTATVNIVPVFNEK